MSQGRHDYPEAIHLLRILGRAGAAIFFSAEMLERVPGEPLAQVPALSMWESLIARACDRYDAKVHGYSWLPNEANLLLQRFAVPLRIILPSLLGGYSRYLHAIDRIPRGDSPYMGRCESTEVVPELLPYALRHLYARAYDEGLSDSPLTYPFCSAGLHFAKSVPRWFVTEEFLAHVRIRGYVGRASVEQFLAKAESRRHRELFSRLSARIPLIAGELADIEDSLLLGKQPGARLTVMQVEDAVTLLLRREARSRDSVLAAALTTWYATRSGVATLKQMGDRFDREPTTLRANIESHRQTSAPLFDLSVEQLLAIGRREMPANDVSRAGRGSNIDGAGGLLPSTRNRLRSPRLDRSARPAARRDGPSRVRNSSAPNRSRSGSEGEGVRDSENEPDLTGGGGTSQGRKGKQR